MQREAITCKCKVKKKKNFYSHIFQHFIAYFPVTYQIEQIIGTLAFDIILTVVDRGELMQWQMHEFIMKNKQFASQEITPSLWSQEYDGSHKEETIPKMLKLFS